MIEDGSPAQEKAVQLVRQALAKDGWQVGTLIHDAVVIERRADWHDDGERGALEQVVGEALDEWNKARGWCVAGEKRLRVSVEKL